MIALFKTAWCEWKLGDTTQAAKDFKRVLDKAVEAERSGTEAQRRRSASLRDEAGWPRGTVDRDGNYRSL